MRKEIKIIMSIVIALSIILLVSSVYAVPPDNFKGGEEVAGFSGIGNTVISVVQTIGTIIAVVIVIWVGIQYLMASTEQKAEYKTKMIAYLIGALLVFIGPQIVKVIYNMATNLNLDS